MPSTTSSSVASDFASSAVITPSLPTFFMASAMKRPISSSPLAEIVATWAISSFEVTFLEFFSRSETIAATAASTPRFKSIGFIPAATPFAPSLTMAWARIVAVVVPSPAWSEVFEATSRTICAPMFSNLFSSSISLATVTPSLVTRGAPKDLSSTTFRPLGPRVTRTASARMSIPCIILSRASTENFTSLAAIGFLPSRFSRFSAKFPAGLSPLRPRTNCCRREETASGSLLLGLPFDEHSHDIALLHDQVLVAVDLHLGSRPFAEQHSVADLNVDRDQLAGFIAPAGANCDDLTLLRLLLCGVGDDDAPGTFLLGLDTHDDNAVVERAKFHFYPPK